MRGSEDDRWIGISVYRPPCIQGIWDEGAKGDLEDTRLSCRCIALYLKWIINRSYRGQGAAASPFESWIEDDPTFGSTNNLERFVEWNGRCLSPAQDDEIKGIVSRIADGEADEFPECANLKKLSSFDLYCEEKNCKRVKKTKGAAPAGVPSEIVELASQILQEGNPLDLILDSCDRFVLGAKDAIKKLICCQMVQMVQSSRGLHPKLSGESGTGKTWCVKVFLHHLPEDAYIAGGLTPKALAYHDLGNRLFILLDDYVPNEDLDTIIKQTSSNFHQPYIHRTVKKQEAATLNIGSEMTWCVTSVDASQDIQVLNRQIPLNTDDSQDLTVKVNEFTISSYGDGLGELYVDDMVVLCREIFRQLRELEEIKVRIPFADRIEWLDNTNRRNPSIFMDLLVGIAALHCFQRDRDEDGYYLATEDDFNCARALFSEGVDVEEMINRLTKKERQFAEMLIAYPEGLTRTELSEKLNVSPARISQIARGSKGEGGLMQKLPGFDLVNVTKRVREDQSESVHVYRLGCFDRLAGFDAIVRLSKVPVRSDSNSKTSKGLSSMYSSKYSKYRMTKDLTLTEMENFSPSLSSKPLKPNSDIGRRDAKLTDLTQRSTDSEKENGKNLTLGGDMIQTLSEMERQGDAYNIETFELEWDLDEGDGAPILTGRGWEERSSGVWYPPSRM